MSLVRLQQLDTDGRWENVKISKIQTRDEEIVVLGKTFRILVDDKEVYFKGKRVEGLNQTPAPTANLEESK